MRPAVGERLQRDILVERAKTDDDWFLAQIEGRCSDRDPRVRDRLIIRLKCKALRNVTVRLAVPAMPVPWRWNAGLKLIAGFDGDRRRFAR